MFLDSAIASDFSRRWSLNAREEQLGRHEYFPWVYFGLWQAYNPAPAFLFARSAGLLDWFYQRRKNCDDQESQKSQKSSTTASY